MTKRKNRLPVFVSDDELKAVSEYRWQNRVPSQTEAARQLIAKGLEAEMRTATGAETPIAAD